MAHGLFQQPMELGVLIVNLSSAPARITRRQARRGNSRQRTALSLRAGQLHEAAAVAPAGVLSTCTACGGFTPGFGPSEAPGAAKLRALIRRPAPNRSFARL